MNENRFTKVIIPFYLNEQTDSEGRLISEIREWDFDQLESEHDYIQWLFPLSEATVYNRNAPLVNEAVIEAFMNDSRLRQNLIQSFDLMLRFYGLKMSGVKDDKDMTITFSDDYEIRKNEWVNNFNHNYLRLTRILKYLMMFGLEDYARALYRSLLEIYKEDGDKIGNKTLQYWTDAVNSD